MASFTLDCPHCRGKGASFLIVQEFANTHFKGFSETIAICGVCKLPILARLYDQDAHFDRKSPVKVIEWGSKHQLKERFKLKDWFPTNVSDSLPSGIPENVIKPLSEAELSLDDKRFSAAASCYRKSLERAVKHLDNGIDGMLNTRIRKLEAQKVLPHSMIELLDLVRLFANEAMHEDDIDPTEEDCIAAREFCHLFFTYAFSLPEKVANAKAKANSN